MGAVDFGADAEGTGDGVGLAGAGTTAWATAVGEVVGAGVLGAAESVGFGD